MSSGSSSPVVTQTKSQDPWIGAQPYLGNMYSTADIYRSAGVGYQPWTSGTLTAPDPWQAGGAQFMASAAYANPYGVPAIASGLSQADQIINQQGITPGIQNAINTLGTAGSQYSNIYNQAQGTQNPYLAQVLDVIGGRVNAAMSGAGRYGSGSHAAAITSAEAPVLAQDYEARQARALQATQGLAGTAGQQADIYGRGLQQAGQYAQLAPALQQAQYVPGQMAMAAGEYNAQRAQQALNDQINLWNATQAYPWQQLERESAILAGAGQLGGQQVSTQSTQVPLAQRLLGGSLAGAGLGSAFGGVGAGVGALGGGLLGLL